MKCGWLEAPLQLRMASTMRELAPEERPRERLLCQGANALKTSELIAILLRTGTKDRPVLQLAEFLLAHFESLEALVRAPIGDQALEVGQEALYI